MAYFRAKIIKSVFGGFVSLLKPYIWTTGCVLFTWYLWPISPIHQFFVVHWPIWPKLGLISMPQFLKSLLRFTYGPRCSFLFFWYLGNISNTSNFCDIQVNFNSVDCNGEIHNSCPAVPKYIRDGMQIS